MSERAAGRKKEGPRGRGEESGRCEKEAEKEERRKRERELEGERK